MVGCAAKPNDTILKEGDVAPDFTLKADDGRSITLSECRGKNVVLFFYPKDETPGCTKEACAFRDTYEEFKSAGIEVYGISVDNVQSHQAFKKKENLNFTLLSDETKEVSKKVWCVGHDGLFAASNFSNRQGWHHQENFQGRQARTACKRSTGNCKVHIIHQACVAHSSLMPASFEQEPKGLTGNRSQVGKITEVC
jgi:peroxiredoxin Q/BCP